MQLTAINVLGQKRELSSDNLHVSSYSSIIPFFLWNKIPEKSWIICPRYGKPPYDVQVGVTGTCWVGEPPEFALSREVQEETGLVMLEEPNFLAETNKGSQKWLWAVCNTEKTATARGIQSIYHGVDNKKCKVGALMYTTRKKSLENMIINSSQWGGLFFLPQDNIIELLLIPKTLAKKWTLPLSKNKNILIDDITVNMNKLLPIQPKLIDLERVWPRGVVIKQNHNYRVKRKPVILKKKLSGRRRSPKKSLRKSPKKSNTKSFKKSNIRRSPKKSKKKS